MSLRLIMGAAGSGKTERVMQELGRHVSDDPLGKPLWLLVPEQATFQAEQMLCDRLGGIMRIRVVSFQRLAYQVLNQVAGAALTPIDELGLTMLIRHILADKRQELGALARAARQSGFAGELASVMLQLKRQNITPALLGETLAMHPERLPRATADKLRDVLTVYSALQDKQESHRLLDSEDNISWLAEHIEDFAEMRDSHIWLDGFSGFTPKEYLVVCKLIQMGQVTVSLALPSELSQARLPEEHLFYPIWETKRELLKDAARQGARVEPPLLLTEQRRFADNATLIALEQYLRGGSLAKIDAASQALAVVAAANPRLEVEAAAREILRLCRDEGSRYRDICVVVRDLDLYESLFRTAFPDHGVPFFIDRRRTVFHHPLITLLTTLPSLITLDYPYESVARCLKCGLFNVPQEAVDILDNYLLATGRRGDTFLVAEEWTLGSIPEGEAGERLKKVLSDLRQQLRPHFVGLDHALRAGKTVGDYTDALKIFLEKLAVEETLQRWAAESEKEQDAESYQVHSQIYTAVAEVLAQLEEVLGGTELPREEYAAVLETGLLTLRLGLIPPTMDQIVVVEAGRSRAPRVKAALVLGLNEGVFPARAAESGVFTEREKESLAKVGLDLGASARRKVYEEQFVLYTALTRASERLWLSYASADEKGSARLPSAELLQLISACPTLTVQQESLTIPSLEDKLLSRIAHPRVVMGLLGQQLRDAGAGRRISPLWWDVYNALLTAKPWREEVGRLKQALFYKNEEPPLPRRRRLAGEVVLRSSVSRLERFRACPFAFFASFNLRLRERRVYRLAATDIGTFYHLALEKLHERIEQEKLSWSSLTREDCEKLGREIAGLLKPSVMGNILASNKRYEFLGRKLEQVVKNSALALAEHARRGSFVPKAIELGFGHNGLLPALTILLADGSKMELTGRIDRLDAASDGERMYLRVIDFKSGGNELRLPEIYHGLRLQLLTYLEVALQNLKDLQAVDAAPAAALYFRVYDPFVKATGPLPPEEAGERLLALYRAEGMVVSDLKIVHLMDKDLSDRSVIIPVTVTGKDRLKDAPELWSEEQLRLMRKHLNKLLQESAEAILAGRIEISPARVGDRSACTYCEYRAVCQFDPLLGSNNYRDLPVYKHTEIWSSLEQEEAKTRVDE